MPDATDRYYHALGKLICRAAEAEVVVETLASDLCGGGPGRWSGMPASQVADAVARAAEKWPNQAEQIQALAAVMSESARVRNWLVHAWVVAGDGDWVELQKPMPRQQPWGRRRIDVDDLYLLAARFRWVLDAVTRVVNERAWELENSPSRFAEPLPEVPPMPTFIEPEDRPTSS